MQDLDINESNEDDDDNNIDEAGMHATISNANEEDVDQGAATNNMNKERELMLRGLLFM
jgi:hypothetical protein